MSENLKITVCNEMELGRLEQGSTLTASGTKISYLMLEREMFYKMQSIPLLGSSSVSISHSVVVFPVPIFRFGTCQENYHCTAPI